MVQLTDTLYAVEVGIEIKKCNLSIDYEDSEFGDRRWLTSTDLFIELPSFKDWSILGTVTPDAIDFDCIEFIEHWDSATGGGDWQDYYKNYMLKEDDLWGIDFTDQDDSFRSLLTSKGCDLTKKYVIIKCK